MNRAKQLLIAVLLAACVTIPHPTMAAVPAVDNDGGASNVLATTATLCATLTSTGGFPTRAFAYWGESDGGTIITNWDRSADLGTHAVGPLSLAVTNLTPNRTYYYRFFATNQDGTAWAATTTVFQTLAGAGPAPVNLRSAARFMILAGSAITSAGGTIGGDVGLSPTTGAAITGLSAPQVNGTIYTVDVAGPAGSLMDPALLSTAKGDLTLAYNDARDRIPVPTGLFLDPGVGNIGGMNLVPGLYKFTGAASITGGNVTLTGNVDDVWIFQIGTTLTVGSSIHVLLAGGAQARNIFWQVGTSASILASASFQGTIMADQSITMDAGSTIQGRALASAAAVTFSAAGGTLPTTLVVTPFVDVTNATSRVGYDTVQVSIGGTNNANVKGVMVWTNELNGATGTGTPASIWLISEIPVTVGSNTIRVVGTNATGAASTDSVIIVRGGIGTGTPTGTITNISPILVAFATPSTTLGGSNNIHVVGTMTWTNQLTGNTGTGAATNPWTLSGISLGVGTNTIRVIATNQWNVAFTNTATIVRGAQPPSSPAVDNANGASNVLSISAVLCGTLSSTGGLPTVARVYWGDTDGGTVPSNWGHTNTFGTMPAGPLTLAVTNLTPNRLYYYRFYATNQNGETWASTSTNFQTLSFAGPAPVNLGSTARFTILAGAAVTTTGGGLIHGDVGASPIAGSAIHLTAAQVDGTIYAVDATGPAGAVIDPTLLTKAKGDLTIAYNDAAGRTPVPSGPFLNPGGGNIGGLNLVPGLYKFTDEAHIEGSDLTLTGGPNDVWIFQIATALVMGADGRKIILAGGAQARNIFWQVGTSATIGTFAIFKGTILADQAITMDTSSTMEGRALAFSAGVTYNGTSGSLPAAPDRPVFTAISRTATNSITLVVNTTPYVLITLQTCPDLNAPNWTTIASNTPLSTTWSFTNENILSFPMINTSHYYRAFLTLQ